MHSVRSCKQCCCCFRIATDEPVTAEPFINGGIPVDASFYFLAIFTRGFYKTLEEINASSQVQTLILINKNCAKMLMCRVLSDR